MATSSLLGRRIDEYLIDAPLGSGGMARVYRALDTRLQRPVALKVIALPFRTDAEYVRRFTREAQAIARLVHPNIVQIYRFGETGDSLLYLAMQFIDGMDAEQKLAESMKAGQPLSPAEVLGIVRDIGAALDHAHEHQVIHRDIKPGNILIATSGQAYLTDFGLSLLADEGTHGNVFGSPHFIAPEQAVSSSKVSAQTDLYSLGVTVFVMLTGHVPFPGDDAIAVALAHIVEAPPLATQFVPTLPPAVDAVFAKVLAKQPEERYGSGADFSRALAEAMLPLAVQSIPATSAPGSNVVGTSPMVQLAMPAPAAIAILPGAPAAVQDQPPLPAVIDGAINAPETMEPRPVPFPAAAPLPDLVEPGQTAPANLEIAPRTDEADVPLPMSATQPGSIRPPAFDEPLSGRLDLAPEAGAVARIARGLLGMIVLLLLIGLFAGVLVLATHITPPTPVVRTLQAPH